MLIDIYRQAYPPTICKHTNLYKAGSVQNIIFAFFHIFQKKWFIFLTHNAEPKVEILLLFCLQITLQVLVTTT